MKVIGNSSRKNVELKKSKANRRAKRPKETKFSAKIRQNLATNYGYVRNLYYFSLKSSVSKFQ